MSSLEEETKGVKNFAHRKLVTIKKNYEFNYIFRRGERFHSKYLTLITVPAKKYFRFGFVVNKKIGNAVVRNKRRRQLKEIVRSIIDKLEIKQYIIIAKPEIVNASFDEIKKDFIFMLKKNNLISGDM